MRSEPAAAKCSTGGNHQHDPDDDERLPDVIHAGERCDHVAFIPMAEKRTRDVKQSIRSMGRRRIFGLDTCPGVPRLIENSV